MSFDNQSPIPEEQDKSFGLEDQASPN